MIAPQRENLGSEPMKPPEQVQPPPDDALHLQRSVDADDPPPRRPGRGDSLTLQDRQDRDTKGEIKKPSIRGRRGGR